ncbi:MAG TPA: Crp/Fnr family transcriptional regulator [Bacteroidales bacterium]|jgi:CRP-like cAMP-binding protein|nr:Crp/Fnr family transcriptional regulator [Bacteroidales bacterium]
MHYKDPYIEICIEGASSVLRGLTQQEKEILDQHHSVSTFRKGETIVGENSKPRGIICLVSGKAKLFKAGAGNREQIIKLVRPQNFISYRSLFSDNSFPFNVVALEESAVVVFEKHAMSRLLRQNGELAVRFIKTVSEDLVFTYNRLVSLTQKHVRGRVAESILLMMETFGLAADGKTLKAMLSREDIAHLSNMTTSNAIRTLSGFASEHIIELDGRKIMVIDQKKLEAISESGQ